MTSRLYVLLYVASPPASVDFYRRLLDRPPVESSPTFAMFALDSGAMLGLWAAHTVEPPASAGGGCEVAFAVDDVPTVRAMHAAWTAAKVAIVQPPTAMEFGYTFVGTDPDGHRLRVFAPNPE